MNTYRVLLGRGGLPIQVRRDVVLESPAAREPSTLEQNMDDVQDPVLIEAPRSFRAFYGTATGDDAVWMDNLVLAWVALREGVSIPRELVPSVERRKLESECDKAERNFMHARDRVRECEPS